MPTPSVPATSTGSRYRLADLEQRAEAADAGKHLGTHRAPGVGLDPLDERVARVDIHAGCAIGEGIGIR